MKIGIAGYTGRMGQLLVAELQANKYPSVEFVGGLGRTPRKEAFNVYTNAEDLFFVADCVIDFSTPEASLHNIYTATKAKKKLIVGTTGLGEEHYKALAEAAKKTAVLQAANTSVGVNLLLALVEEAAKKLDRAWDIEIYESHHKNKVDAPSGTALALGAAAKEGRGQVGNFANFRTGKRVDGDIGYAVSRGGDVVGEHTVTFFGAGERLELGHKATDRALFARGALQAAMWIHGQPAGLYTMRDVLGL